jgi:hypothetical protein
MLATEQAADRLNLLPLPLAGEVGNAQRLRVRAFVEAGTSPHPVSLREPDLSRVRRERQRERNPGIHCP